MHCKADGRCNSGFLAHLRLYQLQRKYATCCQAPWKRGQSGDGELALHSLLKCYLMNRQNAIKSLAPWSTKCAGGTPWHCHSSRCCRPWIAPSLKQRTDHRIHKAFPCFKKALVPIAATCHSVQLSTYWVSLSVRQSQVDMQDASRKRLSVLQGHFGAAQGPDNSLDRASCSAADEGQQLSVVLPETLLGNRWVVRR